MGEDAVVVVGAGPVGLVAAAELARHGTVPRVIDAAPARDERSKALAVQVRSLELLERMGCVEGFLDAGIWSPRVSLHSGARRIGAVPLQGADSRYRGALILPQRETEQLLEEHLAHLGVRVERGTELVALSQDDDGVDCALRRPDGTDEDVRADWLVGCDGANSIVRRALGLGFEGRTEDGTYLLADVDMDWPLPADEIAVFWHPAGLLAYFPVSAGIGRLVASSDEDRHAPLALEDVQRVLDERGPGGVELRGASWLSRFVVNERKVAEYRAGRCFLAGDAAHIHSPAGGQGMNTGMQDAADLAWKLAAVAQGRAGERLLDSYSAERSPVADAVLRSAGRMTRAATLRGRGARLLRDRVASAALSLPAVRRRLRDATSEIGVAYPDGPLTLESAGRGGVRAGERLPDAPLVGPEGRTRLHALTAASAPVLLLLAGSSRAPGQPGLVALAAAVRRAAPEVEVLVIGLGPPSPAGAGDGVRTLTDAEGVLHRRMGADVPMALVVRPDGYVGLRQVPPSLAGVGGYLREVLGWRLMAPAAAEATREPVAA